MGYELREIGLSRVIRPVPVDDVIGRIASGEDNGRNQEVTRDQGQELRTLDHHEAIEA